MPGTLSRVQPGIRPSEAAPGVFLIDPLCDPRWSGFVGRHPRASAFHSVPWLQALRRTYGYQPVAYTTEPPGVALQNGFVSCRVSSWLTGRRLVSLPFSDHCEPLADGEGAQALFSAAADAVRREKLRYWEVRAACPVEPPLGSFRQTQEYWFHQLDLRPDLDALFRAFHKNSTQRMIQRAEREGLTYEVGRSAALLQSFWGIYLITRRRHLSPPQPKLWFRNLIECLGEALQIHVASKDGRSVAAILTIRHKQTLIYKYGGSDPQANNLGGMRFLLWKAIQEAKRQGLETLDLGRTDCDNTGLMEFKDRWGAQRSLLTYSRFTPAPPKPSGAAASWKGSCARRLAARLPDSLFSLAGRLIYRHIG